MITITAENDNLEVIANRLIAKNNIRSIEMHVEYHRKGLNGELDLEVVTKNGTTRYYEYKSRWCDRTVLKAHKQFIRYLKAHPSKKAVCVLVAGNQEQGYACAHYSRHYFHPFGSL